MEQLSEKRKKFIPSKKSTVNDSNYGSMITGTNSTSSLSLSGFSGSELADIPSTSGCSSDMATKNPSKERKKVLTRGFMRKLKSLLPMKELGGKMDTLSTLEQLVNSMRQLNEEQKQDWEFKTPPLQFGSYPGKDVDRFSKSAMYISVSAKNHVVQVASPALMEYLGYPADWWKGRLLKDFVNKKDVNLVNSCISSFSGEELVEMSCEFGGEDNVTSSSTAEKTKANSKFFYARIRQFQKLGLGYSLQGGMTYSPFTMMIMSKSVDQSEGQDDEAKARSSLMIYCEPLISAYKMGGVVPEDNKFSLRHSLFCNYTYVQPNAVGLLGFLPQEFNAMTIFDLHHPDEFQQLLRIHKKIMLSKGQPFKSGSMRLRTSNDCYVEVETEWSSFINPWSMRLEFIIGQHTVIKGPSKPDLFADLPARRDKRKLTLDTKLIQDKILEVLKMPIQGVFTKPAPVAKASQEQSPEPTVVASVQTERGDLTATTGTDTEMPKGETSTSESKSTVIDDKGISSIYNQLNYSHNIKRFLMSHPKSFSKLSDQDSLLTRDDSEDEAINDEEEMPLAIPVVKPPSCGSSTQVHVSEQGHGEEMLSPQTFGDELMPSRDLAADSIHFLTEETLKKHTKLQERLYLQQISEEQPLLLNMRRLKSSRNMYLKKRPRPREEAEGKESAKLPCTNQGIFRSSSNIYLQNFPSVMSNDVILTTSTSAQVFGQQNLSYSSNYPSPGTPISFQPFPSGYQSAGPQAGLTLPSQGIHLVQGESMPVPCIPTGLGPLVPNPGLLGLPTTTPTQGIQWPYYPQTGYTLLPQVMAGFYRPVLQQVQMQAMGPPRADVVTPQVPASNVQAPQVQKKTEDKGLTQTESENPSSIEDTTSSIVYLLDAESSTFQDSEEKQSPAVMSAKTRSMKPVWLREVKWSKHTQMRYTMPQKPLQSVLKMDEKVQKKFQHSELAVACYQQLLEDVEVPGSGNPFDEEADYLFYPGDQPMDSCDMPSIKTEEVDLTHSHMEGGDHNDCAKGAEMMDMAVWSPGSCEKTQNFDPHVNPNSIDENEKGASVPSLDGMGKIELNLKEETASDSICAKVAEGDMMVAMETGFIRNNENVMEAEMSKRVNSPKDGSVSSDDGSRGARDGQKGEAEDAQSSCSKVSSSLTPSDDHSNAEAGSSLKESDAPSKNMKGVSSEVSTSSVETPQSRERESPVMVPDSKEAFTKLFIPLKVRLNERQGTPGAPHWLAESHLSQRVAMTYKLQSEKLEEVLHRDERKMMNLVQPVMVKQQLMQLLNEVDTKYVETSTPSTVASVSTGVPASTSVVSSSAVTTEKQSTVDGPSMAHVSLFSCQPTAELQVSKRDEKSLKDHQAKDRSYKLESKTIPAMNSLTSSCQSLAHQPMNLPVQHSRETKDSDSEKSSASQMCVNSSQGEVNSQMSDKIFPCSYMESLAREPTQAFHLKLGRDDCWNSSSDTNADNTPVEEQLQLMPSSSVASSTDTTLVKFSYGQEQMSPYFQEQFSMSGLSTSPGQNIDVIMRKVIVPMDKPLTTTET